MTSIWEIESLVNLKNKLKNILISRKVDVSDDDNLNTLVDKVNLIGQKDELYSFISENPTEFKLLDPSITSLNKQCPFHPIKDSVVKLYLPYIEVIYNIFSAASGGFSSSTLQHLYLPKLKNTKISYELGGMPKLVNLILPEYVQTVINGYGVITGNSNLKRFIAPKLGSSGYIGESLSTSAINSLQLLDVSKIGFSGGCLGLETLILRHETVITPLLKTSILNTSNENLVIYVPNKIIETYKSETNWSTIADKFKPLEGSKYESTTWYEDEDWYKEEMAVWD